MKAFSLCASLVLLALPCPSRADQFSDMGRKDRPDDYPASAFTALGTSFAVGNRLPELGWNDAQIEAFLEGIRGALKGRPYPFDDAAEKVSAAMGAKVSQLPNDGKPRPLVAPAQMAAYMKQASRRLGLEEADSGLCYAVQETGKGNRPGPDDTVVVGVAAYAADGQTVIKELSAAKFKVKVADLVPGLREGIQMLAVGSRGLFLVPPALSFGNAGWPEGVPQGDPIIFKLSLLEVQNAPEAR
jgi:FKBP-type peptidyl-prolyl cis-trans isomerase FkpA